MGYPEPIDLKKLKTYSLFDRPSKVTTDDFAGPIKAGLSVRDFLDLLPNQLAAKDLKEVAHAVVKAVRNGRLVLLAMGAHVIKVGLNPVLIDLMDRRVLSGILLNGAGIIHDTEIAMAGKTSEDVAASMGRASLALQERQVNS